jgi:hypothetical protein
VLAGLIFGVMVPPIGGADMPVVIRLLNSFTGTAAAMAGFIRKPGPDHPAPQSSARSCDQADGEL